jgi:SAM-dependent methyltransferase
MHAHSGAAYGIGHEEGDLNFMRFRNAKRSAGFLLPHLRAGMTVLDCGCGPGTITVGLAAAVMPRQVIGLDQETQQCATVAAYAQQVGLTNLTFRRGDINALPFPDASFDVVFTNAVLQYLADPGHAVREMCRVLKPGGMLGVRDVFNDRGFIVSPEDPWLEAFRVLIRHLPQRPGGDPDLGRKLGLLLHAAGLQRLHLSVSAEQGESPEDKRLYCQLYADLIERSGVADLSIREGWADRECLTQIRAAWHALGEQPDGFVALLFGEALGWKPFAVP